MIRHRSRAIFLVVLAIAAIALAAWTVALGSPILLSASFVAGAIVCVPIAAQGVRPTDEGLRIRYMVRRRMVPWNDIADIRFAEFRQFGERLQRPAAITYSVGPVRLPGVEPPAPLGMRAPKFPALARVEQAWREAVSNR
jgi:hypothetical protein